MLRSVAVAAVLLPALAAAHDFWAERAGDGFVVRYGHRGGALLDIDARSVKAIRCEDAAGAARDLLPVARFAPREIRVPGACAVLSVFGDAGIWSLTVAGEVNLPRSRARDVVRSWTSRHWAKWVDAQSSRARDVLGDELEIVPVTDLARARMGDKIALRVLGAGKPVRDAVVEVDDRPLGETDSKGEIRIRLRAAGLETVSASVKHPASSPDADADVLEASLTFEVAR